MKYSARAPNSDQHGRYLIAYHPTNVKPRFVHAGGVDDSNLPSLANQYAMARDL